MHLLNSILHKNVAWRKVNVKGYARIFHRNPVKVLSVEEAERLTKPSAIYEEPQTFSGRNNDKYNRTRKNVDDVISATENFKDPNSAEDNEFRKEKSDFFKKKKLSNATSNSHGEVVRKNVKHDPKGLVKIANHASTAEMKTFITCGEKIEMKVISDKQTAERKLR